jgi:glycosyltransferase involved in cell wall biosynthesis
MIALRVVLDGVSVAPATGVGLHALELTRGLIETAPRGCEVRGFTPSLPDSEYDIIAERLPGLSTLDKSALDRRQLAAAWQHGFSRLPGSGPMHAPSLLAPLYRHDRIDDPNEQIIVTIHDTAAWSHPDVLTSRGVAWHRAMVRRAHKYADAVVVPSHSVADELANILSFGDRIRVIPGAVGRAFQVPDDADAVARRLGLPSTFIALTGTLDRRSGLGSIIDALSLPEAPDLPLVVFTDAGSAGALDAAIADSPARRNRLLVLDGLEAHERAVVLDRALIAIAPLLADSFVIAALEAMTLATPLVHTDQPALRETVGDAGLLVESDSVADLAEGLAARLSELASDTEARTVLGLAGQDRARAFTWRDAAEKTWQLHADL